MGASERAGEALSGDVVHTDSEDDLVAPSPPTNDIAAAVEQQWGFHSRKGVPAGLYASSGLSAGSGRQLPTRHASFDAGYLQQRAYAAAQVLHGGSVGQGGGDDDGSCIDRSGSLSSTGSAANNEGIEIAWVWPPCLANDTGPVEFAVNVAPREWLNGKHAHRRVPCWPVSGLSLHITYGERLLQVVELDICGTTKVRLQLPPALAAPHLNFITVMLVDHGRVGPATQMLTMPSSAADEFSGLFRILVEHEMLPHTAAHPEYVSMLFGSSGGSSGCTVRSFNSFVGLGSNRNSGMAQSSVAAAAAAGTVASHATSTHPGTCPSVPDSPKGGADEGWLQHPNSSSSSTWQAVPQAAGPHHQQHSATQARANPRGVRRHSAGYIQVSGSSAVVQQWSSSAFAPGGRPGSRRHGARRASAPAIAVVPGGDGSSGDSSGSFLLQWAAPAMANVQEGRRRRASTSEVASVSAAGAVSGDDSSGRTLTTLDGSWGADSSSRMLPLLAASLVAAEPRQPRGGSEPQEQEQGLQPDAGAPSAALLLLGDADEEEEDASELHPAQAAAALRPSFEAEAVLWKQHEQEQLLLPQQQQKQQQQKQQQQKQQQQMRQSVKVEAEPPVEGRKSFSLDQCAVHVHNEVERGERTRSRMSLDDGTRAGGSGNQLQLLASCTEAPDAGTGAGAAAAAAASVVDMAASSSFFAQATLGLQSRAGPAAGGANTVAVAEPAVVTAVQLQPAPAAGAAGAPMVGAGCSSSAGVSYALGTGAHSSMQGQEAEARQSSSIQLGVVSAEAAAAAAAVAAAAAAARPDPGVMAMLSSSDRLERRSTAEANMSAAFTSAWTTHMLELAADLQYLVVCVPNAFASNLETWFGRIIDSRGNNNSSSSSSQAHVGYPGGATSPTGGAAAAAASLRTPSGGADRRAESSWDSAMYMKRLGQVLDTLQEHKMWTTMSLLLQHCSMGGLDLYPAGCLHQHLQQQLAQERPQLTQQQLQGPLDPNSLTPDYLEHLDSAGVGSANCWVRPVPAMLNMQLPRLPRLGLAGSSTGSSNQLGGRSSWGQQSARAMYLQAAGGSRRAAASIDLTPADLAEARAATAAAAANARAAGAGWPHHHQAGGTGSDGSRRQQRQQHQQHQQHRAPRRSLSWPLGVLYSALSWAQTAQLRHRQRSFWQRAWGLHPLPEGSERDSASSAASSIDASSYRSSSSTQRSSTVNSMDDVAPWARRVSAGLGRLAGAPVAAVAVAAAAAASAGPRPGRMHDAGRRNSAGVEQTVARNGYRGVASADCTVQAAQRSSLGMGGAAAAGPAFRSLDGTTAAGASDAATARDNSAAQRIAALQSSLLAQAALPPDKVESLRLALQAKTQQQQQQQNPDHQQRQEVTHTAQVHGQQDGVLRSGAAAGPGAGAGSSTNAQLLPDSPAAGQQVTGTTGPATASPSQQQLLAGSEAQLSGVHPVDGAGQLEALGAAAAAAAVAVAASSSTAVTAGVTAQGASDLAVLPPPDSTEDREGGCANDGPAETQQHRTGSSSRLHRAAAEAEAEAAAAEERRAAIVAAALTVVGVVEQCTSQLLMVLMVLYCLCFLPSILPGLQPPHLVEAMSRRPAWMECLLVFLIGLHWFVITNVSLARPSSSSSSTQQPRNSMEAHRAAMAAVAAANAALAAGVTAAGLSVSEEAAAAADARRRRRREEYRLVRLRDRQLRLLGRAAVSSLTAAVALGLVCYSLCVFAFAWADSMLGDGAAALWLHRVWQQWQEQLVGGRI